MGMAASQARLLTITARMHDIEYQAQSIQNAKLALATESDQVYQEYVEAVLRKLKVLILCTCGKRERYSSFPISVLSLPILRILSF